MIASKSYIPNSNTIKSSYYDNDDRIMANIKRRTNKRLSLNIKSDYSKEDIVALLHGDTSIQNVQKDI